MNAAARGLIEGLGLAPLPEEGGFFRVTWRGAHGSAILFLITPDGVVHGADPKELGLSVETLKP